MPSSYTNKFFHQIRTLLLLPNSGQFLLSLLSISYVCSSQSTNIVKLVFFGASPACNTARQGLVDHYLRHILICFSPFSISSNYKTWSQFSLVSLRPWNWAIFLRWCDIFVFNIVLHLSKINKNACLQISRSLLLHKYLIVLVAYSYLSRHRMCFCCLTYTYQ